MRYRYVLFDMDGLLLDSEQFTFTLLKDHLAPFGHTPTAELYVQMLGLGDDDADSILKNAYPDLHLSARVLRPEFTRRLEEGLLPLKPGALVFLEHLERNNIRRAVASSNNRDIVAMSLKHTGIADRFDAIVCGDDVENCKPAPDIFLKAAELLCADRRECLVLEDSYSGIRAAHTAGIDAIMVPDMLPPTDEIRLLCTDVCESLLAVMEKYF